MTKTLFVALTTLLSFISLYSQNVGIANPNPTEKLHVNGNIKIGENIWNSSSTHQFKFGDGDYCLIAEIGDDSMTLQANHINLQRIGGNPSKLTINGILQVKDGNQAVGKVLTSTADGVASWQSLPAPSFPQTNTGFHVYRSSGNQIISSYSFQKINFPNIDYNDGAVWSAVNNEYTAPATGVYQFNTRVYLALMNTYSGTRRFWLSICVNGAPILNKYIDESYTSFASLRKDYQLAGTVKCNFNDKVSVQLYQDTGADQAVLYLDSGFSGFRVY